MSGRWSILALLFCVRTTMAVQYQSVAALSPFMMTDLGIGLADVGLLIGLYLSPGMVIAWPGSAIGRRFGDRQVVAAGMVLMLAGGMLIALVPAWEAQLAGRLVSGVGGVVLNVLMSKMVADWFAGREMATAMGIHVNSWPVGIALTLVALPPLAAAVGLAAALLSVCGVVALGLVALVAFYRAPPTAASGFAARAPLGPGARNGVIAASLVWAFFNAGLTMIFAFGPAMLAARDWTAAAASSATSIVLWLAAISVPLGGVLADRLGNRDLVIGVGLAAFAALMLVAAGVEGTMAVVVVFVALGLIGGLPAGPIMSLPTDFLDAGNRATGMGLFFTVYYAVVFVAPAGAGLVAERSGAAGAPFALGAAMMVAALVMARVTRALGRPAPVEAVG